MSERLYWLGFSLFPGVGPARFHKLLSYFETAKIAWEADKADLTIVLGPMLAEQFISFRTHQDITAYAEKLARASVGYLLITDAGYPNLLRQIKNPPFVLYMKGNEKLLKSSSSVGSQVQDDLYVGVVGTRKVTEYGKHVTQLFTRELVVSGCVIVSGLALGVDAIAHQTTLDAGGKTIAVLGCGVDCCNPQENALLYRSIIQKDGLIVSEYPLGMAPSKGSFPSRNRIIAGLSQSLLVTEGAVDSGSLITANDALANDRQVFTVPGPINSSLSQGPYSLIKKGATLVTSAPEMLALLGMQGPKRASKRVVGDTLEEQRVLDLLAEQELSFDVLVKRTGIPAAALGSIVSLMEVKDMIKRSESGIMALAV